MNIGEMIKNYRVNRKIREAKRAVAEFNASIEPDEKLSYNPMEEAREREELENRYKEYLDRHCDYGLAK
ncbi:MAG: hypothetical protein QF506_04645 [Candidatus Woesearchaeota archaeon]|jgi:hypothetical protein|nr:hypothetical protein [Candidatus Woesearchaeota archaeon]|tara:strand:+ start:81 stop:287 length:207 start_codon:yes stop_codon:yes gene_type:complete